MTTNRPSIAWLIAFMLLHSIAGMSAAQTAPAVEPPNPAFDAPPHQDAFLDPDNWYDLDSPESSESDLNEIFSRRTAMFSVPAIDKPINSLMAMQRELEESTGLRIGFAYTQLYQQASGGPGERWAMAGDADLVLDWTLIGRGTVDTGRFVFSVEDRFTFGSEIPPSQLRNEIGSLAATTGAFNDRGLAVRDALWDQRLFDARLRFVVGRGAPDDYAGTHRLQSSINGSFNGNFSGNITTPWPGHGPLAVVSARPTDLFYATVGGANAYSNTTKSIFDQNFDEGKIFGFGEFGVTPEIKGLGRGRYAITTWYMPERDLNGLPSDHGFSITLEQYLAERLWVYGRYGWADLGLTGVDSAWQAALAIDGLLGSPDNVTALGIGYAQPSNSDLRDETSLDLFHRFQLTERTQLTLGAQAFIDPSNAPDQDVLGVFSVRLRFAL